MNSETEERYSRNLKVANFTPEMQEILINSSVLIIGAGGLGSPVISYLTASGIGRIGIVEFDTISSSNLQRQVLYTEEDLNKSKGEKAIESIKKHNINCDCKLYNTRFTLENGADIAKGYDVIVDCTDNYKARYAIDEVSLKLSIPFIYGSAEQMQGQISTFNYKNGKSYKSLFQNEPKVGNDNLGVLSPIPGIVGSLQALETIKILLSLEDNLSGKLLIFNGINYEITIFEI